MDLKERVRSIVENIISETGNFLVDLYISGVVGKIKITITIDNDEGVNIEDCADISRKVGAEIETEELFADPYILEVTSPGLDQPLKLPRQYKKNVGRKVSVTLKDSSVVKGKLTEAKEDRILIMAESKVKKKTEQKEMEILLNDILKTNILVSFS